MWSDSSANWNGNLWRTIIGEIMKLTPIDIKQQQFRRRLRGVDASEVESFLELIGEQVQELASEVRGVLSVHGKLLEVHDDEAVRDAEDSEASVTVLDHVRIPSLPTAEEEEESDTSTAKGQR